jgi:hypothetical protein
MSKTRVENAARFWILLSLAVALAFWIAGPAARAAAPTDGAASAAVSPGATAIGKAAKDNQYLFLFFWKDDTQQSRAMRGVFQAAMAKLAGTAQSAEIQTADAAERAIVARYGVDRAPMPFVLAIAPNGAITKGFPTQFDENQLRQAFVSPCTAECMKALQDRKFVLLCVQNSTTQFNATAIQGARDFQADPRYVGHTEVVLLNSAEPKEAAFLTSLQINPQTPQPVTVLMSPPGSVVGKFAGEVTKGQLITKLQAASSCGPNCSCHH